MSYALLVAQRELKSYLRSPLGYAAAAGALLIDGIWFMAKALGKPGAEQLSAEVLRETFFGITGVTMILGIALSMRLIAQEHEQGTLVLLRTSPISDRSLVLGKFLSVMVVMTVITLLTGYMPILIYSVGRVSAGHILVGYVGVWLLAATTVSVGLFASALAKNQVVAAILGGVLMATMVLWWLVASISDPPLKSFLAGLAVHHLRQRDFMTGVLHLDNVVFYLALTGFFLVAAIKTVEARRWR